MAKLTEAEQNRLILNHQNLVLPLAAKYRGMKDIPFEDLQSEGMLGLVEAARNYDGGRLPFFAWARIRVEGAILNFIDRWEEFIPLDGALDDEDEDRVVWWDIWGNIPTEGWTRVGATPEDLRVAFEEISERSDAVNAALLSLSKRERQMIQAAFLRTPRVQLDQIARNHKLSYRRTSELVYGAVSKMKKAVRGYERNRNSASSPGALRPPSVVAI